MSAPYDKSLFDPPVIRVSELNRSAREILERRFALGWIAGEISNFKRYDSGHSYFTLKDASAQVRCVMFRTRGRALDFQPKEGMQVEVRALVTLYEARGDFQLNVETMRRAGLGPLFEKFLRLKEKLEAEGLFDPAAKRAIPAFPARVGIVTSVAAAALRDILATLRRRNPSIEVILYPVPVQGDGAAERIAAMLATAGRRAECDVLLLARGGGSIEDLWAFNEEVVARAIRACPIPVVVGVGHETDFTIADFVADLRAPTPTAAAEAVSPSRDALFARVAELVGRASRAALRAIDSEMQKVDHLARRLVHPRARLAASARLLHQLAARLAAARPDLAAHERRRAELARRLDFALRRNLERNRQRLERLGASLVGLDPAAVLSRGYSLTRNANGEVVRDSSALAAGDTLTSTFARGWATSEVTGRGE
ncbi:MAG: exodeoxyribonuclease VII large subunit [Betaproteobacteria bacterium]